jgi:hypothetical protein
MFSGDMRSGPGENNIQGGARRFAWGHLSSCSKHSGVKLGSSDLQSDSDRLLDRRVRAVCTVEKKRLTR